MPRIAFIACDTDAGVDLWPCGVQARATRPALAHGSPGEPEDLFVGRRALGIRGLVGLLNNLKIAALLAWAVQHPTPPTAAALQCDDPYAPHLGADRGALCA